MNYKKYIEENIIRCDYSRRGGGIEISLSDLLKTDQDFKMSAYQNYLGGGMLGKICNDCNFSTEDLSQKQQDLVFKVAEQLKRYFHDLTNAEAEDWDSWSSSDYEANQSRPESAY